MKQNAFVHLHVHSEYSISDSTIKISSLLEKVESFGMTSVAITDSGNMFGTVKFYEEAKIYGIKPIIGCEVYIAPKSRFNKSLISDYGKNAYHFTLLVKNQKGYKNLIKLVTASYLEGYFYHPLIDKELLQSHSDGLIGLSGCIKGEISQLLLKGKEKAANNAATFYKELFGKSNFYFELQDHGTKRQKDINQKLINLGKTLSIPLVATNNCHYLKQKDARVYEVLKCIQKGKKFKDTKRLKIYNEEAYLKSQSEMKNLFKDVPDAISNTIKIADRCNFDMLSDQTHLPKYDTPSNISQNKYLEKIAHNGLKKRMKQTEVKKDQKKSYVKRLEKELKIISTHKFSSYFLIIWDFIYYAKKHSIPIGPGRGSACDSLLNYSLGITNIDPINYDLFFERFLNPKRIRMPYIDIDICMMKRNQLIDYIASKYGKDHVNQIIRLDSVSPKKIVKDVGRVFNISNHAVDKIAKLIPNEEYMKLRWAIDRNSKLRKLRSKNKRIKDMFNVALILENLPRHISTHSSGVILSPKPLAEFLPLYKTCDDGLASQFSYHDVEAIGLTVIDIIGFGVLTGISKAEEEIRKIKKDFRIDKIPLDDPITYKLMSTGKTKDVFQLDDRKARDFLLKLKPERFEDLIAFLTLNRLGPIHNGMMDDYINRKQGRRKVKNIIPELDTILKETCGVVVYQEQIMQIAHCIAGFSMGEADLFRRALGRKRSDVTEKMLRRFVQGAVKKGISHKKAEKLFDMVEHYTGYGFNKSHAVAYAMITYQCAYIKANYPNIYKKHFKEASP